MEELCDICGLPAKDGFHVQALGECKAAIAAAIATEREACAKVADMALAQARFYDAPLGTRGVLYDLAAAIRQRGKGSDE